MQLNIANQWIVKDFFPRVEAKSTWETPPAVLSLVIRSNEVYVQNSDAPGSNAWEKWRFDASMADTHLPRILHHLNEFRSAQTSYLNDISQEVEDQLKGYVAEDNWENSPDVALPECEVRWRETVSMSQELWYLAQASHDFFADVFPNQDRLGELIRSLRPGCKIDIDWQDGPVANMPWGLLYTQEPKAGEPIDPELFWGLRFRIDYQAYRQKNANRSLIIGARDTVNVGHAYYWKGPVNDSIVAESKWQRDHFLGFSNHIAIPDSANSGNGAKQELIKWLTKPSPTPMPVIYMYCVGNVDTDASLVFGKDNFDSNSTTIQELDLPRSPFSDVRLVFCNACDSSKRQPGAAVNLLEKHFINRGCSAFLGTVHQIPISLASRFAIVFFHFFYNSYRGTCVSAGEAVSLTRRFLWRKYRNVGGLFYNYVNEYDLTFEETGWDQKTKQ